MTRPVTKNIVNHETRRALALGRSLLGIPVVLKHFAPNVKHCSLWKHGTRSTTYKAKDTNRAVFVYDGQDQLELGIDVRGYEPIFFSVCWQ